jgi:hypothetical protein
MESVGVIRGVTGTVVFTLIEGFSAGTGGTGTGAPSSLKGDSVISGVDRDGEAGNLGDAKGL